MKINDDHMYHGAALTQIAEHPQFTAINGFLNEGNPSRSAFRVNNDIGIYLKYATTHTAAHKEYVFTFRADHLAELLALSQKTERVFITLVCVKAKEICCISYTELSTLIQHRRAAHGAAEDAYTVLVTCNPGKSFRVYVNVPGKKNKAMGTQTVARNRFPSALFAD